MIAINVNGSGCLPIPAQTFRRLPSYYNYLKTLSAEGTQTVSSTIIARDLRLGEVQVRKDMASVSKTGGRPRTGFSVDELLGGIESCLGYDRIDEAVLVGVGNLGRALLSYTGFEENGVRIMAAFDIDERITGQSLFGKQIFPMDKLKSLCQRMHILIGIITVPADQAKEVCDLLVSSGILAIWNFAPVHLSVPAGILVRHENMAASLAMLSRHLTEKIADDKVK